MTAGDNEKISQGQSTSQSDQKMTPSQLVAALMRQHPEWISEVVEAFHETTVIVKREHIVAVCAYLKATPEAAFDFLAGPQVAHANRLHDNMPYQKFPHLMRNAYRRLSSQGQHSIKQNVQREGSNQGGI